MGKKIGNNNPPQSFESLAHAFQGVLDAAPEDRNKKTYFVGEKTKDKCEIDGVERGDITYLSHKKAKHGAAAAAYRLSGRRQNDYKEARIYLEGLVERAKNSDPKRYGMAISSIQLVLARSKSKGYIEINSIRNDVQIILNGVKETTQKSAEALKNDLRIADDSISHFLDDVEAIKLRTINKTAVREKNQALLTKISSINNQAKKLRANTEITRQLRLKRPSFTASASPAAEEKAAQDLLGKIANWPDPQLQLDLANFFACAKSESSEKSAQLQQASKKLLLSLAEQESVLSLLSNELLNTIENDRDLDKLQKLRTSAKQLLSEFRDPDLPFGRLKKLALAGYHWPEETAKQVVSQRDEFFQSLIGPIAGDPAAPPVDVPEDLLPPPPEGVLPPPPEGVLPPPPEGVLPPPPEGVLPPPPEGVLPPPPEDLLPPPPNYDPPPPLNASVSPVVPGVVPPPPDDMPPPPSEVEIEQLGNADGLSGVAQTLYAKAQTSSAALRTRLDQFGERMGTKYDEAMVFFGGQARKAENGLRKIIFAEARAKREAENAKRQAHNDSLLTILKLAPSSVPTALADAFSEICEVKGPKQNIFSITTKWVENAYFEPLKNEQATAPNELAKKTLAVLSLARKCQRILNESEERNDFYRDIEPFLVDLPAHNKSSWTTGATIDNLFLYGIRGLASTMLIAQLADLFKAADKVAKTTEAFNQKPQSTEASEKLEKATKQFEAQAKSVQSTISTALDYNHFAAKLFTNEEFVVNAPIEVRPVMRRLGKALQDLIETALEPNGPVAAAYRMAEAAAIAPEDVFPHLNAAVSPPPLIEL